MLLVTLLFFQHIMYRDMPTVDKNPYTSAADLEQGRKMFLGRCAGCHGPGGNGGKGANLATPTLVRGDTDRALYTAIRYGVPDTEMPSHNMTQREIWQLATFVRSLGAAANEVASGNPQRGAALVREKGGCLQCHMLNGTGGMTGPGLTDIGRRRSRAFLAAKLSDPARDLAESSFRMVTLSTRSGLKLEGIRMNEDTYSIQVRDTASRLHSFWKHDLVELEVEPRTLMPSYAGRFSKEELDDVVAFLGGLR